MRLEKKLNFSRYMLRFFENEIYCILFPAIVVSDVGNRMWLVFKLVSTGELQCESNAESASAIFDNYYADIQRGSF